VPNFLRSRKRSQATQVLEDLRIIDSAVDQYAIETNKNSGATVNWSDVQKYIKNGTRLYTSNGTDILGAAFTLPTVDSTPKVNANTFAALSDVAPADFWSPYR
jgi:type II secretory pathway pseudopilin PulG